MMPPENEVDPAPDCLMDEENKRLREEVRQLTAERNALRVRLDALVADLRAKNEGQL